MARTRTLILVIAIVIALVVGTIASFVIPPMLTNSSAAAACTGGPNGAKVTLLGNYEAGKQLYNLTYTANNGEQNGLYYSFTSNALNWIKKNTASNATFLGWWDYGKEIIGCTGRNSAISNPSAQMVALGLTGSTKELDSNQSLIDVGTALFTTNATVSSLIISKYNASYVFITTEDGGDKAPSILKLLGLNSTSYLTPSGATFNPKDWTGLGQETVIYRLLSGGNVPGFRQVYSDAYVRIFAVS